MDISTAYRLAQQITAARDDVAALLRQIRHVHLGLKLMFITTLLMYFVFVMGFYVADIWGLATWLAQNTSETLAFVIFLTAAILMSTSLAIAKHIFYEHRALFERGRAVVLLLVLSGVFFELFTASSSQQHMAYTKAENSKAFDSVATTQITVGTASDSTLLAHYQGELAKYQQYAATCKKTCTAQNAKVAEYTAKVKATQESQAQAATNTASATTAAITAKASALQGMKDEAHKPVFKSMRDVFGVTISTAVVIIAGIVAGIFEIGHAAMSRILGDKLRYLAGLRETLAKLEAQYLEITGKKFMPGDFHEFENGTIQRDAATASPQTRAATPAKTGFGFIPAAATATGFADSTVPTPLFRYQQPEPPVKKQPFGFVDTNGRKPADNRAHTVDPDTVRDRAHTVKLGETYRQELRQGSTAFHDGALDKARALLPTDQQTGKTGLHNPALGKAEAHYDLPLPSADDRAHTVDPDTVRDRAHTVTTALATTSVYHDWLAAIATGDCAKTVRSTRQWVQKKLSGNQTDKRTLNPREIDAITQRLFSRALNDQTSGIRLNPDYTNGKPKYL